MFERKGTRVKVSNPNLKTYGMKGKVFDDTSPYDSSVLVEFDFCVNNQKRITIRKSNLELDKSVNTSKELMYYNIKKLEIHCQAHPNDKSSMERLTQLKLEYGNSHIDQMKESINDTMFYGLVYHKDWIVYKTKTNSKEATKKNLARWILGCQWDVDDLRVVLHGEPKSVEVTITVKPEGD